MGQNEWVDGLINQYICWVSCVYTQCFRSRVSPYYYCYYYYHQHHHHHHHHRHHIICLTGNFLFRHKMTQLIAQKSAMHWAHALCLYCTQLTRGRSESSEPDQFSTVAPCRLTLKVICKNKSSDGGGSESARHAVHKGCGRNSSVVISRITTELQAERSGVRTPVAVRFSVSVQTGPGVHPAYCTMGTRAKADGAWCRPPSPSRAEGKDSRGVFTPRLGLYGLLSFFFFTMRVREAGEMPWEAVQTKTENLLLWRVLIRPRSSFW